MPDAFHLLTALDDSRYAVSVKLIDFPNNSRANDFLQDNIAARATASRQGLLSGYLGEDGYPMNRDGVSVAELFSGAFPVNGLFMEEAEGVWIFDSTQCFAFLDGDSFILYHELGTIDDSSSDSTTLDHGQFLPFNDLTPGYISARHTNERDALNNVLPDDDPRKGEALYAIEPHKANHFFGLEMEVRFTFPSGNQGEQAQDIVASFTADDDLWVFLDGYLMLDLGGIHSAIPGSINFSGGTATYRGSDGKDYTVKLYKLFSQRFKEQYPDASDNEVQEYLDGIFLEDDRWQIVFRDDIVHTLKLIYLERGAGASNLQIRYNFDVLPAE